MTFKKYRELIPIYPAYITNDIQAILNSYFDRRLVPLDDLEEGDNLASNDGGAFFTFFNRILDADYARFQALLAIEDDIDEYQWLIERYLERTNSQDGSKVGTASGTISDNSTTTTTKNSTTESENSKNISNVLSGEEEETVDTIDTRRDSGTTSKTIDRDITGSGRTDSGTEYTESSSDGAESDTENNSSDVSKNSPMSMEYSGAALIDGVTPQMPQLSWASLSQQAQSGDTSHNESSNTHSGSGSSESGSMSSSQQAEDTTESGTMSQNGTLEKDGTISKTESKTNTISETGTGEVSESGSEVAEAYKTQTQTGTTGEQTHGESAEEYAGRDSSPAELLKKAVAFIKKTSAIKWLVDELRPCFLGIYEL